MYLAARCGIVVLVGRTAWAPRRDAQAEDRKTCRPQVQGMRSARGAQAGIQGWARVAIRGCPGLPHSDGDLGPGELGPGEPLCSSAQLWAS